MHKYPSYIIHSTATILSLTIIPLSAEQTLPTTTTSPIQPQATTLPTTQPIKQQKPTFEAFTGKITKNRVRLRLLPNLDGNIVKELDQNSLVVVIDETEDFYVIEPSADIKAYVFRTYIIDNTVEGSHVNVRLKPDMDAPILTQLNSGDHITGNIDPSNNKWFEISVPKSVNFYVAKDYVQKIGDRSFMAKQEKRLIEVNKLLNDTQMLSQSELTKPFDQINLEAISANYQKILQQYADFPDQVSRAKESLESLQNTYNQKKLAYLEKHREMSVELKNKNEKLSAELKNQQSQLQKLKQQLQQASVTANQNIVEKPSKSSDTVKAMPQKMAAWLQTEQNFYETSIAGSNQGSLSQFYVEQKKSAIQLKGVLETYNRPVKNKPGDYILVNSESNIPIAFLYSTLVNLQDWIGQEVTLIVSPRPNNNFAFPAYFVLGVE